MRTNQNISALGWAALRYAATLMALGALYIIVMPGHAHAQRLENQVAVFAALDKVTARISKLEVPLNQSVEFGSLTVTPRVYSSAG